MLTSNTYDARVKLYASVRSKLLFKAFYEAMQLRIDHKSSYIERGAGRGGEPLAHCAQGGALLQRAQDLQHVRYCRLKQTF